MCLFNIGKHNLVQSFQVNLLNLAVLCTISNINSYPKVPQKFLMTK